VQLKLDTGMARLGGEWQEGAQLVQSIRALPQLDLVGLYSHLACADEPGDQFTHVQLQRFRSVIEALPDGGSGLCCHLANSAGTLQDPACIWTWCGLVSPFTDNPQQTTSAGIWHCSLPWR
jgi:alanine racemase